MDTYSSCSVIYKRIARTIITFLSKCDAFNKQEKKHRYTNDSGNVDYGEVIIKLVISQCLKEIKKKR